MSRSTRRLQRTVLARTDQLITPGAVSATVNGTSVAFTGSITTTQTVVFDGLNISVAKDETGYPWVASVAVSDGTTVTGQRALSGTAANLASGNYVAYVSYSIDGKTTWITGPKFQFSVQAPAPVLTFDIIQSSHFESRWLFSGKVSTTAQVSFTGYMVIAQDTTGYPVVVSNMGTLTLSPLNDSVLMSANVPAGANGNYVVYYRYSTDGGTTWQNSSLTPIAFTPTNSTTILPLPSFFSSAHSHMWSDSVPLLNSIPSKVKLVTLTYANRSNFGNTPLSLPISSPSEVQALASALRTLRSRGVRIHLAIGGNASFPMSMSDTSTLASEFDVLVGKLGPIDGIEFIIQSQPLASAAEHTAFAQALRSKYGANFAICIVPAGSNAESYYPIAQSMNNAGCLDHIAHTYYDTAVDWPALSWRIQQTMTTYGIPAAKIGINMMTPAMGTGPSGNYWTVAQCQQMMQNAYTTYGVQRATIVDVREPQIQAWADGIWTACGKVESPW